jgi:endoglucanase
MRWLRLSLALSGSMLLAAVFASASDAATTNVFKDGFESGSLTAWTNSSGSGQAAVITAAAHSGSYGLRLSNTSGQSEKVVKTLSAPLTDSTTEFWMRVNSASGVETVAEALDQAGTGHEWVLKYDASQQALSFFPYDGTSSTQIVTANDTAPLNTWLKVVVDYNANSSGGAQLHINGHTQSAWAVSGNYARPDGLQRLWLFDNVAGSTDFDDVLLTTPDGTGAGLPVDKTPPTISGTTAQGQQLTTTSGSWSGTPNKYSYSWEDCDSSGNNCSVISGARSNTYVLQASDGGHTVRSVVEARNSAGWSSATRSAQSTAVTSGPLDGIKVSGNQLETDSGTVVQLHGVDRSGTEYACIQGWGIFDGPNVMNDDSQIPLMKAWNVNEVLIGLNEDCWLGINGVPAAYGGQNYINAIKHEVATAESDGIYPVISLFWGASGTQAATGQEPMNDNSHAPAFWQSVAETFKNDPNVIFRLKEEPYPGNNGDSAAIWNCWSQGDVQYDTSNTLQPISSVSHCNEGYPTVGMQSLINIIRGTGATNVIAVPGIQYANTMDGSGTGFLTSGIRVTDPLTPAQLMAVVDVYPNGNSCGSTSCYNSQYAPVAAQMPFMFGEFGESVDGSDCTVTGVDNIMSWADQHGASYSAWDWDTWGGCLQLISSYSTGAPDGNWGNAYKNHLASLP